jgi:hypothetical protein
LAGLERDFNGQPTPIVFLHLSSCAINSRSVPARYCRVLHAGTDGRVRFQRLFSKYEFGWRHVTGSTFAPVCCYLEMFRSFGR